MNCQCLMHFHEDGKLAVCRCQDPAKHIVQIRAIRTGSHRFTADVPVVSRWLCPDCLEDYMNKSGEGYVVHSVDGVDVEVTG